ncbi:MAG: 2-C-methyl-D-erythritol 4-phosphate cytidylyltransferase, partial [Mycoplasmataceae bacterium]|nr:2-C-methyl-D-erythritol 4-phosphate cytidylyltransferase [Mycoplasmataceae bacterium]
MNYAVLLASGRGLRLKSNTIKPLLMLQGKPLFLYALDTFINNKHIDHIVLVVLPSCIKQFQAYLNSPKYKNVYLVHGDEQYRHQSLINAMSFLKTKFKMKPKDVIVSHDIARINVSTSIIDDNIRVAYNVGYASTVLPIHDSLCEISKTTKYISR